MNIRRILKQTSVYFALGLYVFSPSVLGRTCEIVAQECIDGPSTKEVQGYMVHRACWKYKNTMSCWDEDAYDYCSPLDRTPGCSRVNLVVNDNGTMTSQYKCGNTNISDPNIIKLEDSYTISPDETSPECAEMENNPSCKRAESICVGANGLRVQTITDPETDCVSWRQNYVCQVSDQQNFCGPLSSAGCQIVQQECSNYSSMTGICDSLQVLYSCGNNGTIPEIRPENIVKLDDTYTLSRDGVVNTCRDNEENPNCFLAQEVCTQGAETRMIDGVPVYNDCWHWERKYACLADIPVSDDCRELEENVMCQQTGAKCLDDYYVNGQCKDLIREYKCEGAQKEAVAVTNCGDQMWCSNGQCWDAGYPPDRDIGKVIGALAAAQSFTYQLFAGEAMWCTSKKSWGLNNCCKKNAAFQHGTLRNLAIQTGLKFAISVGTTFISAGLSSLGSWIKSLFPEGSGGAVNEGGQAVSQGGSSAAGSNKASTTATGASTVMNYAGYAGAIIWAFMQGGNRYQTTEAIATGVATIAAGAAGVEVGAILANAALGTTLTVCIPCLVVAIIVIAIVMVVAALMECDKKSTDIQKYLHSNLCVRVGDYCARRTAHSCRERVRGHCCYAAKLSRIISEQGRAQLGMGWGDPESPNCRAFTEDEFMQLDFDRMDLSEFIDEITKWYSNNVSQNAANIGVAEAAARKNAEIMKTDLNTNPSYYNQP